MSKGGEDDGRQEIKAQNGMTERGRTLAKRKRWKIKDRMRARIGGVVPPIERTVAKRGERIRVCVYVCVCVRAYACAHVRGVEGCMCFRFSRPFVKDARERKDRRRDRVLSMSGTGSR